MLDPVSRKLISAKECTIKQGRDVFKAKKKRKHTMGKLMHEWQELLGLLDKNIHLAHRLIKAALEPLRELDVVPTLCLQMVVRNAEFGMGTLTNSNRETHNMQS